MEGLTKGFVFRGMLVATALAAFWLVGPPVSSGSSGNQQAPQAGELLGKNFRSIKVKGNRLIGNRAMTLRFFMHSNQPDRLPEVQTIGVTAGCNAWGARFKIGKKRLSLRGQVTGTSMGCSKDPDPWLIRKLRKGMLIRLKGNRLVLTRPAEGVRFVLKRVAKSKSAPGKTDPGFQVPEGDPATFEDLEGKSFESVKAIGEQVKKSIEIDFTNGRLGAYLGCNRMSGEYQVGAGEQWMEDGHLRWFNVITTDMACQHSKDGWFSGLLDKGIAATVKDSWLVLARGRTTIVLKQVAESDFPERVPAGDPSTIESLDGRSFESISVIGRRLPYPIEISFRTGKVNRTDEEGNQVVGNGLGAYLGCNWMGGEYEIANGQLRWFDVTSTLIGCVGGGNKRDAWFSELLKQGVEASESEAGLIFDSGPTQIVFKEVP